MESPKVNDAGFGAQGHVQKSRNYENEAFDGSPISKSTSHKSKMEQNSITELLGISFLYLHQKIVPKMAIDLPIIFYDLSFEFLEFPDDSSE